MVLSPSHLHLDITNRAQVFEYMNANTPGVVVHAAAFTDNDAAEKERGNREGKCWKINVEGTKNIVDAAREIDAYMIYISTGSVFVGSEKNQGPFKENDPVSSPDALSWYATTKAEAEKHVTNGVIIRISHPVKDTEIVHLPLSDIVAPPRARLDYIHNLVSMFDRDVLYPLFTDQFFPITYMNDLVIAIKRLIMTEEKGIYHVVSFDVASPFQLASYAIARARYVEPELPKTTFDEFIKNVSEPKRYAKYSAIEGAFTRKKLDLPSKTWKEIIDCLYPHK